MGMGGSSLFPEVLSRTFGATGRRTLHVLDTTDPGAIARIAAACPPARTVHPASSKSGSTIETRSPLEWTRAPPGGDAPFSPVPPGGSEPGVLARHRSRPRVFGSRQQ